MGQKAEVAKVAKYKKIQPLLSDWIFEGILVGTVGFEPTTPCTPCKCATKLRHAPIRSLPLRNLREISVA